MDSAAQYLSKNAYFNICHGKNSKVTAVDKFQKFRVDTPLKGPWWGPGGSAPGRSGVLAILNALGELSFATVSWKLGDKCYKVNHILSCPGMLPIIFLEFMPSILFFACPSKTEVTRQNDRHDGS